MGSIMDFFLLTNFIVSLVAVANPFGNIAVFLSLTSDKTESERHHVTRTMTIAVAVVWLLATWLGDYILAFFGISLPAFELAGSVVLTLLGISLLQTRKSRLSNTEDEQKEAKSKESIAVVPLAIPVIAGPGSITTLIIATHKYVGLEYKLLLSLIVIAVTLFIGGLFYFASNISRALGVSGMKIMTRVMGLILVAIAMQMAISGINAAFHLV
jgi:multiple antibiotic resistance protein